MVVAEIALLSGLVVGFLALMACSVIFAFKQEKRREKLEERKVNAFEKIADRCDNEETK